MSNTNIRYAIARNADGTVPSGLTPGQVILPHGIKRAIAVVTPQFQKIDEFAAAKRIALDVDQERAAGRTKVEWVFHDNNTFSPDDWTRWSALCTEGEEPILIDIGPGEKYRHTPWGSKLGREMARSSKRMSGQQEQLAELIRMNNLRGILKKPPYRPYPFADMFRKVPYVIPFTDAAMRDYFLRGMDVIDCWFRVASTRDFNDLLEKKKTSLSEAELSKITAGETDDSAQYLHGKLRKVWLSFNLNQSEVKPLTLPWFLSKLFSSAARRSKDDEKDAQDVRIEIYGKVTWWQLQMKLYAQQIRAVADKEYEIKKFTLADGKSAGIAHVSSHFEEQAVCQQYLYTNELAALWVVNESTRHPTMTCLKFNRKFYGKPDIEKLSAVLRREEPEVWFFEGLYRSPIIMNGSIQYTGGAKTHTSDEDKIRLTREHIIQWKTPEELKAEDQMEKDQQREHRAELRRQANQNAPRRKRKEDTKKKPGEPIPEPVAT